MRKKYFSKKSPLPEEAIETGQEGSEEAPALLEETTPKAGPLSRAVYNTFFGISYGVVFGSLLVGKLIPKSSMIDTALHDGAVAAREAFEELEKERLTKEAEVVEAPAEEQTVAFDEGEAVPA